jgi:hypothetical protein
MKRNVHIDVAGEDGYGVPVCVLEFEPFDSTALIANPESGRPKWQSFVLPSGESLELSLVFQSQDCACSLHVRSSGLAVAAAMCDSLQFVAFLSPLGAQVSLQLHDPSDSSVVGAP